MSRTFATAVAGAALVAFGSAAQAQAVFDVPAVEDVALKSIAGRQDVNQAAQSESNATVTRNSIGNNSVTGTASVDGQAFQNLSGLSLVNINTGNNVAINSAMNVNIAINPGQ